MLSKYIFSSLQAGILFRHRYSLNTLYTSNIAYGAFFSTTSSEKLKTPEKRKKTKINLTNIKEQLQSGNVSSVLDIKSEKKKIPIVKALKDAESKEEIQKTLLEKEQIEDRKLAIRILRCPDVRSLLKIYKMKSKVLK